MDVQSGDVRTTCDGCCRPILTSTMRMSSPWATCRSGLPASGADLPRRWKLFWFSMWASQARVSHWAFCLLKSAV